MRVRIVLLLMLLSAALPFARAIAQAAANPRIALIIANDSYANPENDLPGARRDAKVIETALRDPKLGFQVTVKRNLTTSAMRQAVREFESALRAAGPAAIGLLYYAGHGGADAAGTDNLLIPVDVDDVATADVAKAGYGVRQLTEQLAQLDKPSAVVIVIDACRTASAQKSSAGIASMVSPDEQQDGFLVALSTGKSYAASDSGHFAQTLAQRLLTQGVTLDQVFEQVRIEVARVTNRQQVPSVRSGIIDAGVCLLSCNVGTVGPYSQNKVLFDSTRLDAEQMLERIESAKGAQTCPNGMASLMQLKESAIDQLNHQRIDAAGATYLQLKERAGQILEYVITRGMIDAGEHAQARMAQEAVVRKQQRVEKTYHAYEERLVKTQESLEKVEKRFNIQKDKTKALQFVSAAQKLAQAGSFEDATDRLLDAINELYTLQGQLEPHGRSVTKYPPREVQRDRAGPDYDQLRRNLGPICD